MTDVLYKLDESAISLCPTLYNALRERVPGGVVFANQGESMVQQSTLDRQRGQYHTYVVHSGEYYRVNCLFCDDTRHRLWVNHMFGQPDANGQPMRFLVVCYNEDCLADPNKWKDFCDTIFGFRNLHHRQSAIDLGFTVTEGASVDPMLTDVDMPGDCPPITSLYPQHKAWQYMVGERNYAPAVLDHYRVCYCRKVSNPRWSTMLDRIVFPIFMRGKLVGWQGRYVGKANWQVTPKYYGLPGMRKRFMLYNYDNARDQPYVVVTEGPTDVHSIGDTAVALLGKNLSQYQINLLVSTWEGKPIILMLDADAIEENRAAVTDLENMGTNPIIQVDLPDGYDPGDYSRVALLNAIRQRADASGVQLPAV